MGPTYQYGTTILSMGTSTGAIRVGMSEDSYESILQNLQVVINSKLYLHFETSYVVTCTSYIKCKPMLVQYLGNCSVLIFNSTYNGIKEQTVGMSHLDLPMCSCRICTVIKSLHMLKSKERP